MHSRNVKFKFNKKRHYEWSSADASHWRADARRAWARRRTTHARRRAEGRRRAGPNLEAEEAGQVHVNLHKNLDQPGGQISVRARVPVVLKVVGGRSIAGSSPKCMPRIMIQRDQFGIVLRVLLLQGLTQLIWLGSVNSIQTGTIHFPSALYRDCF